MKLTILGDIHGKWNRVNRIISHENNPINLSTGDLCNYHFELTNKQRLIFVPGNHEAGNYMKELAQKRNHPFKPLFPGETINVNGIVIAGLPGVYSPYFFDKQEKPIKYFSRYDIEKASQLSGIDILLCHIGPHGKVSDDIGNKNIAELIKKIEPRYVFFGHDHKDVQLIIGKTKVIGLAQPKHSYTVLDTSSGILETIKAGLKNERYTYPWEKNG